MNAKAEEINKPGFTVPEKFTAAVREMLPGCTPALQDGIFTCASRKSRETPGFRVDLVMFA
jgi:hypothetical protein